MVLLCVRCGRNPRATVEGGPAYLCAFCLRDPETHRQVRETLRVSGSVESQRRHAMDAFQWRGGWGGRT